MSKIVVKIKTSEIDESCDCKKKKKRADGYNPYTSHVNSVYDDYKQDGDDADSDGEGEGGE